VKTGLFITFEGIDGAGKSTQLSNAIDYVKGLGRPFIETREPGGTELGERIRSFILDGKNKISAEAETMMMFSARLEHLNSVIKPALDDGKIVLCDRFTDATYAYQGFGSGVDLSLIENLERIVQNGLQPDRTFFFDLDTQTANARIAGRELDRFESEAIDFHQRVREGYLARAKAYSQRFSIINADRSADEIRGDLLDELAALCS
jgi:dTMP kinase